ncbi:MAG: DMT family transporter [Firmicutes bacterium]|nr:DMT family transporter [Bacillota bacterium]
MHQVKKAYGAAVCYTVIIGLSFLFVKMSLFYTNPLDLLAYRFSAALLTALLVLLFGRHKIHLSIGWKDILAILPLALFYPILFFIFQTFGLAGTGSSEAGIIQAFAPIFTFFLATFFLKETASLKQKIFVLLSVAGVIFIFVMQGVQLSNYSFTGWLLILLSTLSTAVYSVMARRLTTKYPVFTLTLIMTLFGFITFALLALGSHLIAGTVKELFTSLVNPNLLLTVLYLGVLSSFLSSFLTNYTLSQLEAFRMSIFSNLATVITIMAGIVFLHETLFWYHLAGTLLILAGVLGSNYYASK